MKIKTFNKTNSGMLSVKDLTPLITVNPKAGLISFSKGLTEKLKITDKSRVNFIQDEEHPLNWYLEITQDPQAFALREHEKSISFNCTAITRELYRSCGLDIGSTYRLLVASEPEKIDGARLGYAIITKSAKEFLMRKGGK